MLEAKIIKDYTPGLIGRVAELHGTYYYKNWGFGLFFEAKVATEISEFLRRYDKKCDGFWSVLLEGRVEGSVAIDGLNTEKDVAHLRWFIISDLLRGKSMGNQLLSKALNFCRCKGYKKIYLWTFEGLYAAKHLYEKNGFKLTEQHRGTQWGTEVNEQRFELQFD
jgi:N-acetylglutamate synthase-like GNAT family acetyltransferase